MTRSGRSIGDDTPEARHRGQKEGRPVAPTALWSDVRRNPRNFLFVLIWGVIAIGWGLTSASDPTLPAAARVAGTSAAVGGALLWLSYVLYLRPGPLSRATFHQQSTRRRLVFLTRHLWLVAMAVAAAAWLAHWISP